MKGRNFAWRKGREKQSAVSSQQSAVTGINSKFQAPNSKQIPKFKTQIQNSNSKLKFKTQIPN
jgi:hypothetical protein